MHSQGSGEEDICKPQELGTHEMQPCLFLYQREHDEFWPVESQDAHELQGYFPPDDAFLLELSTMLIEVGMDDVLGL